MGRAPRCSPARRLVRRRFRCGAVLNRVEQRGAAWWRSLWVREAIGPRNHDNGGVGTGMSIFWVSHGSRCASSTGRASFEESSPWCPFAAILALCLICVETWAMRSRQWCGVQRFTQEKDTTISTLPRPSMYGKVTYIRFINGVNVLQQPYMSVCLT